MSGTGRPAAESDGTCGSARAVVGTGADWFSAIGFRVAAVPCPFKNTDGYLQSDLIEWRPAEIHCPFGPPLPESGALQLRDVIAVPYSPRS